MEIYSPVECVKMLRFPKIGMKELLRDYVRDSLKRSVYFLSAEYLN